MNPTTGSPPLFPCVDLFLDAAKPRSAAANMAVDEALLLSAPPRPILRFYTWLRPSFTFGYFQKWQTISPLLPRDAEPMRRWTGGGLVDHRQDTTYSLVIPASAWSASPRDSYRAIHQHLAACLRELGLDCHLALRAAVTASSAQACFAGGHAEHDVLLPTGKISGAAQRRHRCGILHQGSIALADLPPEFPRRFAAALARDATTFLPPPGLDEQASARVNLRYGRPDWVTGR